VRQKRLESLTLLSLRERGLKDSNKVLGLPPLIGVPLFWIFGIILYLSNKEVS
jgi:hypothetical protein